MATDRSSKDAGRYALLGPHFAGRQRLLVGAAAACLAYAVLWGMGLTGPLRVALSWDFGVGVFLLVAAVMMLRSTREHIERRARQIDISLTEIAGLTGLAAAFSLYAAAGVLGAAESQPDMIKPLYIGVGGGTIILSWFFVHTLFAIHYAHEFHDEDRTQHGKPQGGLNFPGDKSPDYWDFVYFAAVIAMTCQVSDISIDSRAMRHLVTAHGIISFFLNTVIVALTVSIAAGLI
ncbi:DUF1345 domain-containing protein [Dongia sp.]|uniref:DUF1345 domain-containing protein n=1 Tax=Dongia sp. TaxID=1977262 RepID=UPI0035AEEC09